MRRVNDFVNRYLEDAKQIECEFRIPFQVTLAQCALETGWGDKCPGNMMFGMKPGKTWQGKKQLITTTEYHTTPNVKYPEIISIEKITEDKYKYRVKDWFRAYDLALESFRDYAKLITGMKRYKPAFQYTDAKLFAREIAKAGYATDPKYAELVCAIINVIERELP